MLPIINNASEPITHMFGTRDVKDLANFTLKPAMESIPRTNWTQLGAMFYHQRDIDKY